VSLANKVGASDVVARLSDDLKDDSELYRRMVLEAVQASSSRRGRGSSGCQQEGQQEGGSSGCQPTSIVSPSLPLQKVLSSLGAADIDTRLQDQLMDGLLYTFQEQTGEEGGEAAARGEGCA